VEYFGFVDSLLAFRTLAVIWHCSIVALDWASYRKHGYSFEIAQICYS